MGESQVLIWLTTAPFVIFTLLLNVVGILVTTYLPVSPTWAMALPFTMLFASLTGALFYKPRLRCDLPLLAFHLALLLLIVLLVAARLTYFEGGVMISEGERFHPEQLDMERSGPLHPVKLDSFQFAHAGFEQPKNLALQGLGFIYNRVRYWDQYGRESSTVIGNDRPLVIEGYRIYSGKRRGLVALFRWQNGRSVEVFGEVQLEDNGGDAFAPAAKWQLPDGTDIWAMLEINADQRGLLKEATNLYKEHFEQQPILIRSGDERKTLMPGESINLNGARLTYEGVNSWMSYRIIYEPMKMWIMVTLLVAILSLIWFYSRRIFKPIICVH